MASDDVGLSPVSFHDYPEYKKAIPIIRKRTITTVSIDYTVYVENSAVYGTATVYWPRANRVKLSIARPMGPYIGLRSSILAERSE